MQIAGWLPVNITANLTNARLTLISIGAVMTIAGGVVVREARRLAAIDFATLFDAHRQAAQVGGMGVFLFFFCA